MYLSNSKTISRNVWAVFTVCDVLHKNSSATTPSGHMSTNIANALLTSTDKLQNAFLLKHKMGCHCRLVIRNEPYSSNSIILPKHS